MEIKACQHFHVHYLHCNILQYPLYHCYSSGILMWIRCNICFSSIESVTPTFQVCVIGVCTIFNKVPNSWRAMNLQEDITPNCSSIQGRRPVLWNWIHTRKLILFRFLHSPIGVMAVHQGHHTTTSIEPQQEGYHTTTSIEPQQEVPST